MVYPGQCVPTSILYPREIYLPGYYSMSQAVSILYPREIDSPGYNGISRAVCTYEYIIPQGDWLARVLRHIPGSVYLRVYYTPRRFTRQGITVCPGQCVPTSILYPREIYSPGYYGISWAVCTYEYIIPQGDWLARELRFIQGSVYLRVFYTPGRLTRQEIISPKINQIKVQYCSFAKSWPNSKIF